MWVILRFFGAVSKLERLVEPDASVGKVLILKMTQLINLDTTGLDALANVHKSLQKRGCQLILCGPNDQPLGLMQRAGFIEQLGPENCVEDLAHAITRGNSLAKGP